MKSHQTLADWEKRGIVSLVATQNVDGFHKLAGNQRVEELHGSIRSIRCHRCEKAAPMESFLHKESSVHCNGKLRPNVVLFVENLPQISWNNAMEAISAAELVLVIGQALKCFLSINFQ